MVSTQPFAYNVLWGYEKTLIGESRQQESRLSGVRKAHGGLGGAHTQCGDGKEAVDGGGGLAAPEPFRDRL